METFDPQEALARMTGRRQYWGCDHEVSSGHFIHWYRLSNQGIRRDLPICPLVSEIKTMTETMDIPTDKFCTVETMFCGYHLEHHMIGGGRTVYVHRCCLESIKQFRKMLEFLRDPKAAEDQKMNLRNAEFRFGEMIGDGTVEAALALRQKVRLRNESKSLLEQSFGNMESADQFLSELEQRLGIKEKEEPTDEPTQESALGSILADEAAQGTEVEAVNRPSVEEIIRDPFCLVLRREQGQTVKAVVG